MTAPAVFLMTPQFSGWVEFLFLIIPVIGLVLLLESRVGVVATPTAKRFGAALLAILIAVTIGAAMTHAAIYIDGCGGTVPWYWYLCWCC